MPTNPVGMADHLVAMSSAGAHSASRPVPDPAALRSLLSHCAPEDARDAFLRFTWSNRTPQPHPVAQTPGPWQWCRRHPIVTVVIAFLAWAFTTGIAGGQPLAGLVLLAVLGGVIYWLQRRANHEKRAAAAPINPWPYGAERVPAYGALAGESTLLRPEAELLGVAVLLAETIQASPVVRSDLIYTGTLLEQINSSLYTISHQCHRIWWIRSSLEKPESTSDVGRALQAAIDQRVQRVEQNWRELLGNVAQLAELAVDFDQYAKVLRDHARHHRLMADGYGMPIPSAPDPQWQYLQEVQANLSAQVGFLNDTAVRVSAVDLV